MTFSRRWQRQIRSSQFIFHIKMYTLARAVFEKTKNKKTEYCGKKCVFYHCHIHVNAYAHTDCPSLFYFIPQSIHTCTHTHTCAMAMGSKQPKNDATTWNKSRYARVLLAFMRCQQCEFTIGHDYRKEREKNASNQYWCCYCYC